MTDLGLYMGAVALGVVAGMRTMAAPTVVRRLLREGAPARPDELGLLSRPITGYAALALAAASAATDRLRLMPKRSAEESIAVRALAGATSGAAICSAKERPPFPGALLGAFGAAASSYVFSLLHRRTSDDLNTPNPLIAIAQDALASGIGILVLSQLDAGTES